MESYFFNAEPTEDLEKHPTGYDREYDADSFAGFFAPFLTEYGVLGGDDSEACQVYARDGSTLGVKPGCAYVKGRMVSFDGGETVPLAAGHVVARMNKGADVRAFQLLVVDAPVQADGDVYDLPLAQVSSAGAVTDERVFLRSAVREPNASVVGTAEKSALADADSVVISDSADSGKTKRVLWSRIKALFALAGHKHAAGDVTSGVLDQARVPILPEGGRVVSVMGPVSTDQDVAASASVSVTIPFANSQSKLPRRVRIWFSPGTDHGETVPCAVLSGGRNAAIEIITNDNGTASLWAEGCVGGNQDGYGYGFFRAFYRSLPSDSTEIFDYQGWPSQDYWSGFGGHAFTDQSYAQDSGNTAVGADFRVYLSSFGTDGVTLKIKNRASQTGHIGFTAYGFAFN